MNNPPMDNTWRTKAWDQGTISDHAQRLARRLERAGLEVRSVQSGEDRLSWSEVVQAFSDAADDFIDQHVRRQREKAEYINAHASNSEAPQEAQETPHQNRIIIRVHFLSGNDFIFRFPNADIQGGWTFRNIRGVDMLIIGHGVPRKMFPLCNVHSIELLEDE